jgi:ubiquinone/menaquinone biosynthesis C-methylase UbiE
MTHAPPPVCDYAGSDYQSRFWEAADRRYEDAVEAIALRRLFPTGAGRMLEIGAGAGRHTRRYPGFDQIVLLDYSRSQLEQARQRLGAGHRYLFVAGDAYRLPFAPGVFDGASMIRVLHHMVDPQAALHSARRCLRAGSTFVLEFANKRNVKAILRWFARRQAWSPFDPSPIEFAELNFNFHPRAVIEWLNRAGFDIQRLLTVSHFRLPFLKRLIPLPLLVTLDSLAQWTGDFWQLTPSVFVGCQAAGQDEPAPPAEG